MDLGYNVILELVGYDLRIKISPQPSKSKPPTRPSPKMPKQAQQSKEKKNKNPIPTSSIIPLPPNIPLFFSNIVRVVDVKQSLPRYARVIKMLARTGSRGGVQQVRVEFMEDKDRTMVRNVWVRNSLSFYVINLRYRVLLRLVM